ncbi:MAG: alpha/beta fold hydrolase [Prevotella sp.]|nr:alpha/beta fold hydrolase [Prevotella sp.]
MKRLAPLIMLCCSLAMHAQNGPLGDSLRAERALQWLLKQQVDSLLAQMGDEMKTALTREQLAAGVEQMEGLAGPYKEHGAWNRTEQGQLVAWQTNIVFGETTFSFVVAFDADSRIQGLRIMPAMPEASANDDPLPADAVEVEDTVRSAHGPALPAAVVMSGRSANPPMVVMVHGSGALDRDETVMANKTFRQLSRLLAERGISSLRYDKRTYVTQQPVSTMDDETITDAIAAVALARVYSNNVYLLGHSLGAMLAPVIAQRTPLDGIIMMAAPARDLSEVVAEQVEYLMEETITAEQKQQTIEQLRSQSPHYFEPQRQVKAARQLCIPMLLLQGERDYQVTMHDYGLWQQALKGHKNAELHSYPRLNHLFLEGQGKSSPQEYLRKGSIPQQVADDIAHFINNSPNP